ncbi:MAG: inositol monophosphatase [Maricaulis sp.]|nr:inositol monophosphatase [Maricaulis sp.]HAQ34010.1 inositol monophosphatase [Alphaproteobacteria bacterium]
MQIMQTAARKAGRKMSRDFGEIEHLQVARKGPADFVSAADRRSEEVIHEVLAEARPGYGFLMEERGEVIGTDKTHRWIVDPLDGTLNFLHGQPHFAISIALEREGEIVAGLVYNPANDEMFHAEKGRGAWVNDRRLRVAGRTELYDSVIATGTPFFGKKGHARFLKELHKVMAETAGIRRYGAASLDLAWVAAGRFDAFWERDLKAWDIAAGLIIVREAGGFIAELDGGKDVLTTGNIGAGNDAILKKLIEKLKEAA